MKRQELITLFERLSSIEASWALETLGKDNSEELSDGDLGVISDCLCKINDHASETDELLLETQKAEREIINIRYPGHI